MKKVTIILYSFDELNENAKKKAIESQREFELSVMRKEDFISGDPEYDTEKELRKAYNAQYAYYEQNDEPIIESIEANDYLFFSDGELANCTTYVGKHEKAGITELKIGNDIYII
jgi:hypothetical protein